jgi:hypothetical protein
MIVLVPSLLVVVVEGGRASVTESSSSSSSAQSGRLQRVLVDVPQIVILEAFTEVEVQGFDGEEALKDSLCYFRHVCGVSQCMIWILGLYMLHFLRFSWNESFFEGRVFKCCIFLSAAIFDP